MRRRELLAGLAAILSGCGGGGDSAPGPSEQSSAQPTPTHVVIDGDSIAVNIGPTWATKIEAVYPAYVFHHLAVPGTRAGVELAARWDSTVPPTSPVALKYLKGYYILVIGTNDVLHGGVTIDESWNSILNAWRGARSLGFKVIAATLHTYTPWDFAKVFKDELNARILASPSEYDQILRLDQLFPDPYDESLLFDHVHFTEAGNQRVLEAVSPMIRG